MHIFFLKIGKCFGLKGVKVNLGCVLHTLCLSFSLQIHEMFFLVIVNVGS